VHPGTYLRRNNSVKNGKELCPTFGVIYAKYFSGLVGKMETENVVLLNNSLYVT
jgi:hypothetical protein